MKYGDCKSCGLDPRDKYVPPSGCAHEPLIMFVGEAPGQEEVAQGEPFVGKAGRLLRSILSGLEIDSSSVYYTNVCMCRPPGNRTPKSDEIRACQGRLLSEITAVRPKIIVALGNTALSALLGGATGITKRRGMYSELIIGTDRGNRFDIGVIPTLHPAGVLRAPDGFRDIVNDIDLAVRIARGEANPVVEPPYDSFVMVEDESTFRDLLETLYKNEGLVTIDLETEGLNPHQGHILSMTLAFGCEPEPDTVMVLDYTLLDDDAKALLAEALLGCRGCFHNSQFDVEWLWVNGTAVDIEFDTMLAHYAIDERKGSHGLKKLATQVFAAPNYGAEVRRVDEDGRELPLELTYDEWVSDPEYRHTVMRYNGADAYYTHKLRFILLDAMNEENVKHVHDDILIPAAKHFIRFSIDGMLVDTEYIEWVGRKWTDELTELEERLRSYPGAENINFRSPKQISDFLFNTLHIRPMPADSEGIVSVDDILAETNAVVDEEAHDFWRTQNVKRGTKAKSTSTYMLWYFAQQHEFPRMLVRHRILSKQYGAYHDGYVNLMDVESRIRPRYRLHGTRTGRLSSTDPNIHAMPRRAEIKRIFVADPGYTIISADYSQAEVRMVAHLAQDKSLIKALGETDIHRAISKRLFRVTDAQLDAMPKEEREIKRRAAKTITFGLIYGRSAPSIAPQIGISNKDAEALMRDFFTMMPDVRKWIASQHALVMQEREVVTIFGRKRRFPLVIDKRHASEIQRQAVNFPVQSAVSDMTLLAYMRIVECLDEEGIDCKLWPHVHDGFYFLVPKEHEERAIEVAIEILHDVPFETDVPFSAEIQTGPNWGELKKVFEG